MRWFVIQHAVWLYYRFTLSYRDIEDLLAERGVDVSHETIRRWVENFGGQYANRLRAMRPEPSSTWHVDGVFLRIRGEQMYLWRAVDEEGEVLDILLQLKRDMEAATSFLHKAIRRAASAPEVIVSDKWRLTEAADVMG